MTSPDVRKNLRCWNAIAADYQERHGEQLLSDEPLWGAFGIRDDELGLLGDVEGLDVLELGSGAAQLGRTLSARGARVVAIDVSREQIAAGRVEGPPVTFVCGDAEELPFASESFDLIVSDHAFAFLEPAAALSEASRVLRPGGRLVTCFMSTWAYCCWSDEAGKTIPELLRSYFELSRLEDDDHVQFPQPLGRFATLALERDLDLDALVELQAPEEGETSFGEFVDREWASRWPAEMVWAFRKRGGPARDEEPPWRVGPPGDELDDARANRQSWNAASVEYQEQHGPQIDDRERVWGLWSLPETELGVLGDLEGKRVLELGCGGGQWSSFLSRDGIDIVGMDNSIAQLRHAPAVMERIGGRFSRVNASGEALPFADESFDVVFCDHGAMSFADPYRTVPEVARILRLDGRLVFNAVSPFLFCCYWDEETERPNERLTRNYFELGADRWEGQVDYQLAYGKWIALFKRCGLKVERWLEPRPGPDDETTYTTAPHSWARRFPAELLWVTRKLR
ncbi:MAG: methyltransferase domain-containing protein [Acidobacteriota bacterium]